MKKMKKNFFAGGKNSLMGGLHQERRRRKHLKMNIIFLSFLIPLLIMLVCCIAFEVQPFGDNSLLIIDGLHQYMPFYSVLYDKLKSGGSLFYSFRSGLGINFLSLFSYYLSSPFNLLILLFKKTQLNMAVSMIIVLKIAFSGMTAGIYFLDKTKRLGMTTQLRQEPESEDAGAERNDWKKRIFRKKRCALSVEASGFTVLMVSLAYALCSYMVGYCWNVMWLDAIMIFPIIIMGLERLIEKKDGRLYCLALFYALYCNYYIAFMICIFLVIWYVFYSFSSREQYFSRGIAFAFYSLLAAGMSAVLLLPAYLGIKQTASGETVTQLPVHSFLTGVADLLNRQFALASPITHDNFDGNANLYVGIFTVIAAGLYFLNREISLLDKIKKAVLIALFYVSFSENILNFIWHGFHDQYGIPNRFSFLFGFVLLYMTWEVFMHLSGMEIWHAPTACLMGAALLAFAKLQGTSPMTDEEYLVVGLLLLFYGAMLFLYALMEKMEEKNCLSEVCREGEAPEEVCMGVDSAAGSSGYCSFWKEGLRPVCYKVIFCAVAMIEIAVTAFMGFDSNGQILVSKFFYGTEDMKKAASSLKDGTFYRSELAESLMVDESTWYPINAVALFGSTATDRMVTMMDSLGFYTGCNEYLYKGATPVTNLLLNVRYLYYHPEDTLQTDFQYKETVGDFDIYENQTRGMSIGYLMNDSVEDWYYESAYPFRVLNDLGEQAFGVSELFHDIEITDPVTDGCTAERTNDGEYYFEYEESKTNNMTFTIPVSEGSEDFYLFYDGTQVENAQILVDGENVESGDMDGYMLSLGKVEAGSVLTVTFQLKGETQTGYVRLSAAGFDREKYLELADITASRAFVVSEYSDSHIEGTVSAEEGQTLFFSIPYDTGWTVTVDGEKVETSRIGDAFLAVKVDSGAHQISLSYTPPGFTLGWKISVGSLAVFLVVCGVMSRRKFHVHRRRRKREKSENQGS